VSTAPRAHDSFRTYLAEINDTPLLTAGEERALAARVRGGDAEARDGMVRANLRLVVNIARGYSGQGLAIEDLVSEGNMGLLRAVEGFDPAMNNRFSTYASFWIKQSIRRGLVNTAKAIRLPAYLAQLLVTWRRAAGALTDALGRPPTREEVAGRLGLSKKKVEAVTAALGARVPQSDQGGDEPAIAETLGDARARPPGAGMAEAEDVEQVLHLLGKMEARDAAVLRMRFGLEDEEPKTLKEIGDHFGLTRERVRQIETGALAKLAESVEAGRGLPIVPPRQATPAA
jgi:RNA polymerase primary sigma factor